MAKHYPDGTLDQVLDLIATADAQHLCQGQPTTFGDIATMTCAVVAMAGGDFTKAAGATDGRRVTVAAKAGVAVTADRTADHVALVVGSTLICVTTCTPVAVTTADTVNFPAYNYTERQVV